MSTLTPDTQPKEEKSSGFKLKEQSLKAAGWSYMVGDSAIIVSGILENNYKRVGVGAYWGLGGLAAARYGNANAEKQLELLSQRLGSYLRRNGVEIPKTPTTEQLAKKGGVIDHIEAFLYAHPSETLNTIYALGAGQLIVSGMQQKIHSDTASGALIAVGALAGLLIPEKKPDLSHPTHGAFSKALAWVQEKPLRLSGAMYYLNNASMIWGAFEMRKKQPYNKSYLWRFLTAGSFIFANSMLALSNKKYSLEKEQATLEELAKTSATVIAAQPPEVQEALVQQISGYLGLQPEIHMPVSDISEMLHSKLKGLSAKPHPVTHHWRNRVQQFELPVLPDL
jgi:hypothetical protein